MGFKPVILILFDEKQIHSKQDEKEKHRDKNQEEQRIKSVKRQDSLQKSPVGKQIKENDQEE